MGLFGKKPETQVEEPQVEEVVETVVEKPAQKVATVIGSGITIVGDFNAKEDIQILGTIKGNIVSQCNLLVANGGALDGNAEVSNFDCDGNINGEVRVTGNTKLGSNANFNGTLYTEYFQVEVGAHFDGRLVISSESKAEEVKEEAIEEPTSFEDLDA